MCFSIPLRVLRIDGNTVYVEGGKKVKIGRDVMVSKGEFLQVAGNVAVGKLTKNQGLKVRSLIKSLQ